MAWGITQRGLDQLPLGSVQVPGTANPVPLAGSSMTYSDVNNNLAAPAVMADQIQTAVFQGRCYCATTTLLATATNPALIMGMSLFNASTAKNMYVFSLEWLPFAATATIKYNLTTSNPTYANVLTPTNMLAGFATASLASVTSAAAGATASVAVTGTTQDIAAVGLAQTYDFFATHHGVLLPAGANNGVSIFGTVATAGNTWGATVRWVEF